MKIWIIVSTFIIAVISSCETNHNQLISAIKYSGDNKSEIERVLSHYKNDTYKYKAAIFLIVNSVYHYSLIGSDVDSIKKALSKADEYGVIDSVDQNKWKDFNFKNLTCVPDIKVLKADYLIKNIDLAFKVWKEKKWNRNLSFDDFCNYILPYRISDEVLDNWREIYHHKFNNILDSLYNGDDALEAATILLKYLKSNYSYNFTWVLEYPHLGGEYLIDNHVGKCRDACDFITYVFRSVGIPISCDYYTYSPETRKGHIWNAILTKYGWLPFSYPYTYPAPNCFQIDSRSPSSIYRQTFSNKENTDIDLSPAFIDKLRLDVSNEYFKNSDLHLKSSQKYSYVGVFNRNNWIPIAYCTVKNGEASFYSLGPDQIYIQMEYKDGNFYPIGDPFVFDGENIKYFHADLTNRTSQCITRKFPLSKRIKSYMDDLKDGVLSYKYQGPDFIPMLKIDTVFDGYNNFKLQNAVNANQIKYSSSKTATAQLAEVHFFNNKIEYLPSSIKGDCPATRGTFEWQLNDNNPLSYFISKKGGASILFNFDTPAKIDSISIIPRSDENWIRLGDKYVLYYWDSGEWKSLGIQIANSNELIFDDIPQGALLYLHNLYRGEEELPFFIENGKQIFVSKAID